MIKIQYLLLSAMMIATPLFANAATPLPVALQSVMTEAKLQHVEDYEKLRELADLKPENYLSARVQKPTAARAMQRLELHEGVFIEALIKPSLALIAPQDFPKHMDPAEQAYWKAKALTALQLGAAAALTHQQSPHAEQAIAWTLESPDHRTLLGTLCVFYGRLARHDEGVKRLLHIAETQTGAIREGAILGLGKTRHLSALEGLENLLERTGDPKLQKTALHALGHLANRAAQKAKPLQNDPILRAKVLEIVRSRLDQANPKAHEGVTLSVLALVLKKEEWASLQASLKHKRAKDLIQRNVSRAQRYLAQP